MHTDASLHMTWFDCLILSWLQVVQRRDKRYEPSDRENPYRHGLWGLIYIRYGPLPNTVKRTPRGHQPQANVLVCMLIWLTQRSFDDFKSNAHDKYSDRTTKQCVVLEAYLVHIILNKVLHKQLAAPCINFDSRSKNKDPDQSHRLELPKFLAWRITYTRLWIAWTADTPGTRCIRLVC